VTLQRFFVTQEHDELWRVRGGGALNLYSYPTESEARAAALALAKNATESGAAATVVINPAKSTMRVAEEDTRKPRRFTGM
jgi:hypothetical protein